MSKTDITIVLDRSGSMSSIWDATIEGFNSFISKQKEAKINATVTLVQFDDKYDVLYTGLPIGNVPLLNRETFIPRGWTALMDAVGNTIDSTGKRIRDLPVYSRPDRVMFVIVTDGGENASKMFHKAQIKDMITHQRDKYSWDFVFLGANMDAVEVAAGYGILGNKAMSWGANNIGTANTWAAAASYATNYVSADSLIKAGATSFKEDDRKRAMGGIKTGGSTSSSLV